jgi:hypothetical protein
MMDIIYSLCLAICTCDIINSLFLPLIKKIVIFIKTVFNGRLHMSGSNEGNLGIGGFNGNNPTPEPKKPTPDFDKPTPTDSSKKKKNSKKKKIMIL